MGNTIGSKRKTVKVMRMDGTTFKVKPPCTPMQVLRDHPGHTLLDSADVKRSGLRSTPLDNDAPLKPGRLYFLIQLPRQLDRRAPRRAWSAHIHLGAKERLETLRISRRSVSDLSAGSAEKAKVAAVVEEGKDGSVRVRVRLSKAEMERLMKESRDSVEAAEKIMEFASAPVTPKTPGTPMLLKSPELVGRAGGAVKEKRTRFVGLPDEIIP